MSEYSAELNYMEKSERLMADIPGEFMLAISCIAVDQVVKGDYDAALIIVKKLVRYLKPAIHAFERRIQKEAVARE